MTSAKYDISITIIAANDGNIGKKAQVLTSPIFIKLTQYTKSLKDKF